MTIDSIRVIDNTHRILGRSKLHVIYRHEILVSLLPCRHLNLYYHPNIAHTKNTPICINCTSLICTNDFFFYDISFTGGNNCLSPITYVADSSEVVWESPKCPGWEKVSVYTIRISTEGGLFERSTDKNSYVLPDSIKKVVNVSLIAENVCGEMTELDRQPLDVEASGTGKQHCFT